MRCADVTYEMRDQHSGEPAYEARVGDLLWNPKGPEGHVIVRSEPCSGGVPFDCGCGGWGTHPCLSNVLVCECGEDDSYRDHHYVILAKDGGE